MKFLFVFLALSSSAVATSPPVPVVTNGILGITAYAGEVHGVKGMVVAGVTDGMPGYTTGLATGDVVIGFDTVDVLNLLQVKYTLADEKTFLQFPPSFGHMNNEQWLLVYRPSLDQTSTLIIHFGGKRAAWPGGSFGILAIERPKIPVSIHSRNIPGPPDVVVHRVHPYTPASLLGVKEGDVITAVAVGSKTASSVTSIEKVSEVFTLAKDAAPDDTVTIWLMRPKTEAGFVGDLKVEFPARKLK